MTAQQLKNSILQMAVQGELVPQDPADEPASVLLERIRAEKERMVKEGKIKKEKTPSVIFRGDDNLPYEKVGDNEPVCIADELPFEIPNSWEWARLGSLLSIVSDGTHKTPHYVEKGVPFLSVQNISSGKLDLSKIKYIDEEEHQKLIERVCPQQDDILFCRIGTLGKAIRVTWDFSFSIFVSLGLLRPVSSELTDFIVFVINSPVGNLWIQDNKVGGGTHTFKVNLVDIPKMLIPVPPFSEQQKILKKVEEYTILINQFSATEQELYLLENDFPSKLKNSILQQAVQGKLVPQDPADEPASVLLERIRAEKEQMIKDGEIKRDKHESAIYRKDDSYYEKADGVERCIDDEILFEIPESWEWVRLGNLFWHNTGKALNSSNKSGKLLKYITTSNLYWDGFKLDNLKKMYFTESEIEKCTVTKGDLLVCEGGDYGRAAIWNFDYDIRIQNHIHRLRAYLPLCIEYYFFAFYLYKHAGWIGGKGIGIQGLSSNALHALLFPLPPINEQERIALKLKEIMIICDDLKM